MRNQIKLYRIILLISIIPSFLFAENNTFLNKDLGFSIIKPEKWHFFNYNEYYKMLNKVANIFPDTKGQKKVVIRKKPVPLVTITKNDLLYKEDKKFKFNYHPSIIVKVYSYFNANDKEPAFILKKTLDIQMNKFKNFSQIKKLQIKQEPKETLISGNKSSYARLYYTIKFPQRTFDLCTQYWIISRNNYYFQITSLTRQDETTGSLAEVSKIIDTIVIKNESL